MLQDMNFIRTGCRLFRSFVRVIMSGVELRNAVLGILNEDSGVLNRVLMRDGAHFLVSGYVNEEDIRYRATVNRRELHAPKVTVWCAVGTSVLWVRFLVSSIALFRILETSNGLYISRSSRAQISSCGNAGRNEFAGLAHAQ